MDNRKYCVITTNLKTGDKAIALRDTKDGALRYQRVREYADAKTVLYHVFFNCGIAELVPESVTERTVYIQLEKDADASSPKKTYIKYGTPLWRSFVDQIAKL